MPWGEEQDKDLVAFIEILKPPPTMALPDREMQFQLHTDASDLSAGAALTQDVRGAERVIGYYSHRWSKAGTKRSATERGVTAVLWAIEQHRQYLWGRKFLLVTDCFALTWLFKIQTLSEKLHWWAFRSMGIIGSYYGGRAHSIDLLTHCLGCRSKTHQGSTSMTLFRTPRTSGQSKGPPRGPCLKEYCSMSWEWR